MTALDRAPTLAEIGEALFGPQWVSPLARALGVSLRTVQYWNAKPDYRPSSATTRKLVAMLERRHAATDEVLARCRAMVAYFDEIRTG